jgi:hypothetical protein
MNKIMTIFLTWSYLLVAAMFLLPTYVEGIRSKEGGPTLRAVGLLLCLIWPAVLLCVTVEVLKLKWRSGADVHARDRIAHLGQPPARL